ncbi:MAG: cytochrome c biogenesis protein CcdA [Acidimicrobiia bacterium]
MGGDSVSYLAAFGGGVVSFLSPCVLPLVPAYLALITGLEVAEVREPSRRHLGRIARDTGLFVAGFSVVFILLGLGATSIGHTLVQNQLLLTRISGLVVLSMALFLLASLVLRSPWLFAEKRFHASASRLGPFAAPIIGAAFAFGWTPCIGPVLGSVLAISATRGDAARGASLLAVYSLGLGIPFLVAGLAFGHLTRVFAFVKRHFTALTIISATSLAFFGVLLTFNRLTWVTSQLQGGLRAIGLDNLVTLG